MPSGCIGCCHCLKDLPKKVEARTCQCENGVWGVVIILSPAKCASSTFLDVKLDVSIQMFPRTQEHLFM